MPRGLPAGDCIDAPPPKGLRNSFAFACIGAGSGDLGTSICRIHRRSRCVGLTSDQPYRGSHRVTGASARLHFSCDAAGRFGNSSLTDAKCTPSLVVAYQGAPIHLSSPTRRRYRRKTPAPRFGLQLCRKSLTNIHVITFDVDVTQRPVALLLEFPKMT
jgi:hypothetical protein